MRYKKRILAFGVAVILSVSLMAMGAGAEFTDQNEIPYPRDVKECVDLYIINGFEDGSFRPYGNLTRAQMCKMLYVLSVGGRIPPSGGPNSAASFSDTKTHWANAYIGACVDMGLVNGVGGNRFNPEGKVTANQAAKMLLAMLGYDAVSEGYVGAQWENNVAEQADALHLYGDMTDQPLSDPLYRAAAAHMIVNALHTEMVSYQNGSAVPNGMTLLSKSYDVIDMGRIYAGLVGTSWQAPGEDIAFFKNGTVWIDSTTYTGLAQCWNDANNQLILETPEGEFSIRMKDDTCMVLNGKYGEFMASRTSQKDFDRLENQMNEALAEEG